MLHPSNFIVKGVKSIRREEASCRFESTNVGIVADASGNAYVVERMPINAVAATA
jgi:hypothetical protein